MTTETFTYSRTSITESTGMRDEKGYPWRWEESSPPTSSQEWLSKIRTEVYKHKEVEALYVSIGEEGLVDYWIVIPQRDITLVRTLVECQQKDIVALFVREHGAPFQLDFHIIYREGREVENLVPSDAIEIPDF